MSFAVKLTDAAGVELLMAIDEAVATLAGTTAFDMDTCRYIGVIDRNTGQDLCGVTLANQQEISDFMADPDNARALRRLRRTTAPNNGFTREG